MKHLIYTIILFMAAILTASAQEIHTLPTLRSNFISEDIISSNKIRLDTTSHPEYDKKVIIGNDTVSIILPQKNYGRYDRGLYNFLVIPKGQWMFGLTASYGELSTEDIEILSILQNFDMGVKSYSINPSISYFFRNNQSVGVKFGYSHSTIDLNNLSLDIDADMSFTLKDISYEANSFSAAINYRNYIGLGPSKRFAVFNEVDLLYGTGTSRFKRLYNGEPRETNTSIKQGSLNFSPGVCIFIMDYVSFQVSFGVFGLNLKHETQKTNGIEEGSRITSGANFKFNLFNINFGIAVSI